MDVTDVVVLGVVAVMAMAVSLVPSYLLWRIARQQQSELGRAQTALLSLSSDSVAQQAALFRAQAEGQALEGLTPPTSPVPTSRLRAHPAGST